MIHYQLQCAEGHGFDGWFRDSAAFDRQSAEGLLECPNCGDTAIVRALMAPAVPRRRAVAAMPPAPPAQAPAAVAGDKMPAELRARLQQLRSEVERHCDYVGPEFAEEARRIHRGESDRRGIYGEATAEQTEDLAAEGIEVARIPWVPRSDA